MLPRRFATMPMIDFMVVVLPAPLRPSRVTTSPGSTSRSTPCRMCDSPYQAWRSRTRNSGSGIGSGGMGGRPHVGFDHRRIVGHHLVVALGQDLAAGEHGDA